MNAKALPIPTVSHVLGVAWAVALVFLFILAVDSFIGAPSDVGDSAIYLYVGQGILQGEIPYVDRWDNKGPFFYVISAAGILFHNVWGIWVVQVVFLLGAAIAAFCVYRRGFGLMPALCVLALFFVFHRWFLPANTGNYTEQYALLFQFLALYLFIRSQEDSGQPPANLHFAILHLSIGALGAAAFLIRPNLVALWLAIGLCWLVLKDRSARKLAWSVLGGGSVLAVAAALFASLGALGALWSAVFGYNFAHSIVTLLERLNVIRHLFFEMFPVSYAVIVAWCIGIVLLAQRRTPQSPRRDLLSLAVILLPLELIGLSLSGFTYRHYYLAALPVAMLLLAYFVWVVSERLSLSKWLLTGILIPGIALYSLTDLDIERLTEKYMTEGVFAENNESRLAKRIAEATSPEDNILVWGKGATIYLLSGRDAPSRFFFHHALVKPYYTTPAMREGFFADVMENRPAFIIDSRFFWFPPLDRAQRAEWRPHERQLHDIRVFEPLFDFVEANYIIVAEFPPYVAYALRSDAASSQTSALGKQVLNSTYDVHLNDRTLTFVKNSCRENDARKRFILQVFPVDNSVIDGRAHTSLDFNFLEGETWHIGEGCLVSVELPAYPIASIRVGQYNLAGTGDDWLSEYTFPQAE